MRDSALIIFALTLPLSATRLIAPAFPESLLETKFSALMLLPAVKLITAPALEPLVLESIPAPAEVILPPAIRLIAPGVPVPAPENKLVFTVILPPAVRVIPPPVPEVVLVFALAVISPPAFIVTAPAIAERLLEVAPTITTLPLEVFRLTSPPFPLLLLEDKAPVVILPPVEVRLTSPPLPVLLPESKFPIRILPLVAFKVMLPPFLKSVNIEVVRLAVVMFIAVMLKFLPSARMLFPPLLNAPPAVKEIAPQTPRVQGAKVTGTAKVMLLLAAIFMGVAEAIAAKAPAEIIIIGGGASVSRIVLSAS